MHKKRANGPRVQRTERGLLFITRSLGFVVLSLIGTASLAAQPANGQAEISAAERVDAVLQSQAANRGLGAALKATMRNHPALKGKQAEVNAQSGLVDSAEAGRYPSLSSQIQTLDTGANTATLRLRQPLWAFGRIDTAIDQAEAESVAEQTLLLQVQRELIEQTAVAYAAIQSLSSRLAIAELNVEEHERLHERIETRQEGQLASEADVSLASSRLIRAQGDLYRLQGEMDAALTELLRLTQIVVSIEPVVADEQLRLPGDTEALRLALDRNADLLVKRAQVEVARWTVENTRLADTPTLYFQIDQDVLDKTSGVDRTRVGLVLEASTQGLGFATRGRTKSVEQRYEAALFDRDATGNEIRSQLDTLLLNRALQKRLRMSQQAAVTAVEETLASFVRQYDSGRKSWMDVLNTQREVTEVRQQLAQIDNTWQTITLRIAALIGELDHLAGITSQ
ncbi:MAG: adhesin transport system outer membrane protein [Motiliproteus sp.]|jgi:adhesin transport system outer membrane protein